MLLLDRKKHGIHFYTVWMGEKPIGKSGIIAYREARFLPKEGMNYTLFDTLLSDLSVSEEEMKQHLSKSCKYKVNRATREDVQLKIYFSNEITDEKIQEFCNFFVKFWESKGVNYTQKERLFEELCQYRDAGALSIGQAFVHGEPAVYHTHVLGTDWARLLQSASLYRLSKDEDGKLSNIIGMANRYLHFQEMVAFKNAGKKIYDWGGAGKEEEVADITRFKESFGGTPAKFYEFEEVKGFLPNLFKLVVKICRK